MCEEIVRLCAGVYACICAGGALTESHTGPQSGIDYPLGTSLRKRPF